MVSDSQSTRGVQRRRVKFFWRLVVGLVCAFVGIFWYSFNEALHANHSEPINGRLPLEKRVSIEAFQRDVEPHILSARQALFKDTGGARPLSEGSWVSSWGLLDEKSWNLHSQETDGGKPSADAVYDVMREHVEPYGYVLAKDRIYKDGSYSFVWRDYDNGGAVYVSSLYQDQVTNFHYESGGRPSDGSVPDPRVLIPNDSRDVAGYVSSSLPEVSGRDLNAPFFPETDGSELQRKRQSIEVFQRDVEPGILSFRDEIVGDSPYYVAPSSPSEMETRKSYPTSEYWLESQRVQCGPRDVGRVVEWGNARLNPLGYVLVYDYASPVPGVGHYLAWKDEKNGGLVTVILREKNTEFSYKIGARPSDGSVPDPTVLIPNDHRDLPDPAA
mgnify:FL=1